MDNRDPPENVKKILRKEVNYGCPVEGCGNPYLSYHHFDPKWHVLHHHNPEGMIALCLEHAGHADVDSWTPDQLREMKRLPFVTEEQVSRRYYFFRKDVVCMIGNIAIRVKNILEIDGERVIGFERDDRGYDRLNLRIRDREGNIMLEMINNDWTAYTRDHIDLICPARGKEIRLISKDKRTKFRMRFHDYSLNTFKKLLNKGLLASTKELKKTLEKNQFLSTEEKDRILNKVCEGHLKSSLELSAHQFPYGQLPVL